MRSTTWASPSRRSTRRSRPIRARSGWHSCIASACRRTASSSQCSRVGAEHVELVAPLASDTPVGRFLSSRGPGLHHIAYRVADIDATMATLRGRSVELLDETPREGALASRIAFLHPRSADGVLTELVQR